MAALLRLWTSSGSLMTTVEVLLLQPQKMPKTITFTLAGIAKLLHLPARQCTSTHRLQDGWIYGSRDAWFHAPMLLSANTINIFHQWTRQACTHDTLWRQHYIMTSKEHLTISYVLSTHFWIRISSATSGGNYTQIDHHLSKLWKKKKGTFLWNSVYMANTQYIHIALTLAYNSL